MSGHDHFGKDGTERPRKQLKVRWPELVSGLGGLDPDGDHDISVQRETVPIVLVPGLFGTRLQTRRGEPAWEPCSTLLPAAPGAGGLTSMLLRGAVWSSPQQRARWMLGDPPDAGNLQVPDGGERGWAAVAADLYGGVLRHLQRYPWSDLMRLCFSLPVYAVGHNWASEISRAGAQLARRIEQLVQAHDRQGWCRQVILVTHSSGGLVARAACLEFGAQQLVMGVFHGAQPTLGIPALYRAFRAGFAKDEPLGGLAAAALGHTGEHLSALLGRMPGVAQLLPGADYLDSAGERRWLRFRGPGGALTASLPDDQGVAELYRRSDRYWGLGLAAAADDGLWQPAGPLAAQAQHPNSYHALGRGRRTAEQATFGMASRGRKKLYGRLKLVPLRGPMSAETILGTDSDRCVYGRGRFAATLQGQDDVTMEISLQPPAGDGDGLVPVSSARALVPDGEQTRGRVPRSHEFSDVEHFGFFDHRPVLDYLTAVVEQICQDHIEQQVGA